MDARMEHHDEFEVHITTYDRLLRAWFNSMEMVRDFEMFAKRVGDRRINEMFKEFAEDEGMHASKLRELLLEYKGKEERQP